MTQSYVGVYLLDAPFAIDRVYDYAVPGSLCDVVHRGSFVTVPFGNANRKHLALVVECKHSSPYPRVKPVLAVSSDRIALSEELLGLALFMKEQTLCTVGDAVRAIIPSFLLSRMTETYAAAPDGAGALRSAESAEDEAILQYLRLTGEQTTAHLRRQFGTQTDECLRRLRERRLVVRDAVWEDKDAARYIPCHRLCIDAEAARAI